MTATTITTARRGRRARRAITAARWRLNDRIHGSTLAEDSAQTGWQVTRSGRFGFSRAYHDPRFTREYAAAVRLAALRGQLDDPRARVVMVEDEVTTALDRYREIAVVPARGQPAAAGRWHR